MTNGVDVLPVNGSRAVRDKKSYGHKSRRAEHNGKAEGSMILDCSITFDPSKFPKLGPDWKSFLQDERSRDLTTVDFSLACFRKRFPRMAGWEKYLRLGRDVDVMLGGNHLQALLKDYEARGEESVLECLRYTRHVTHFSLFGQLIEAPGSCICSLSLQYESREQVWNMGTDWLSRCVEPYCRPAMMPLEYV